MDEVYKENGKPPSEIMIMADLVCHNINNVTLHAGLINNQSLDNVPNIDFAFLDLDIVAAMNLAFDIVHPKLNKSGYLALHDIGNFSGSLDLYNRIMATGEYKIFLPLHLEFVILEKL
jgi:hypothetical protein